MSVKGRSAKGEIVDFDVLKIKEQMANAPPSVDVRARQDFIDRRLKRRLKTTKPVAPKLAGAVVSPTLPGTEEFDQPSELIDEEGVEIITGESDVNPATPKSKQKARPPQE